MELKFDKEKNFKERLQFIHYYANWVKSVKNEVWSRQQAELINSFMLNSKNFKISKEQYLRLMKKRG